MGKKKSVTPEQAPAQRVFDSPFAGLQSLRAELPAAEKAEPETETSRQDSSTAGPDAKNAVRRERLVLQREKKGRAGKTVTRLSGLPSTADREHYAKQLKKELGCGAVLEGKDVVLLGDVGSRAKTRLEALGFTRVVLGN